MVLWGVWEGLGPSAHDGLNIEWIEARGCDDVGCVLLMCGLNIGLVAFGTLCG